MLNAQLLYNTVPLTAGQQLLILNSAADPFVRAAALEGNTREIVLAEDNVAALRQAREACPERDLRHVPFHEYTFHCPAETMDAAVMNLLYQPRNAWMLYGLQVAAYALKPGGLCFVTGAKDRGILTIAKRMQEIFGNVETLAISKGQRVLRSRREASEQLKLSSPLLFTRDVFASGKLDEGTRLLLEVLEVRATDVALDIGCGGGFIGAHIAGLARKGSVTMVDASLAAVAMARQLVEENGLTNAQVLPSDGTRSVASQRFDLVVTNPPFHIGGIQTTAIAERFIHEASRVLHPRGRFYLVANRFLKYEPALQACFKISEEVGGNTRYKVLRALQPANHP